MTPTKKKNGGTVDDFIHWMKKMNDNENSLKKPHI
jgi:hypothetical protein